MSTLGLQRTFLAGVLVAISLVLVGLILMPAAGRFAVLPAMAMLACYGVVFWLVIPGIARLNPAIMPAAVKLGSIAGLILAGEIVLEYLLLPTDNTVYGTIAFGCVFAIYLWVGASVAWQTRSIRNGVLAAVAASIIATLIWAIVFLSVFYLYRGTPQAAQVHQAEGDYLDFARSGMADFEAFIMEDYLGAVFYHALLGPLVAAILGAVGGLVGRGAAQWKS